MRTKKITTSSIVKVSFFTPRQERNGETEFFFGSLAAIYEVFTPDEIGCKVEALWSSGITEGRPKSTRNCVISKHTLYRKMQQTK